ncbi:MAG: dihydrolipoamide acetyltransferase family protein [Kineosporiaceae bacterium]
MSVQHFRLPDAGEGLTEAEIVTWKVRPGDRVAVNDVLVEVETAKALTELPSPYPGVVRDLLVAEGSTVAVGTPIIAVDVPEEVTPGPGGDPAGAEPDTGRAPVLVGYGPAASTTPTGTAPVRRPRNRRPGPVAPALRPGAPGAPGVGAGDGDASLDRSPGEPQDRAGVRAKPPVRRLARDLGVELATVTPTGPGGVVSRHDVERAARLRSVPETGTFHSPGGETRIPVRGIRRATARAVVDSAFTAPHVTVWLDVDMTRTMRLIDRLRQDPALAGSRVGPLLLVSKALLLAVWRYPEINAHWDDATGEIVVKHDINLGIAVATPRGLVVPNIKDAGRLALPDLARALDGLTATARAGRTPAAELAGGTVTITNIGVFGVDAGTPILNPGEAAVLALGQIRERPWVHKGRVRPRQVAELAVSFDHRIVDGDLGSRFLAGIGTLLEDPARALTLA